LKGLGLGGKRSIAESVLLFEHADNARRKDAFMLHQRCGSNTQ